MGMREVVHANKLFISYNIISWYSTLQSIFSPKLKGFLYKNVNEDELNGIVRLHLLLSYQLLNTQNSLKDLCS